MKDESKINERNPNFIKDYIEHIKSNMGKVDVIFVSSHREIRQALRNNNIKFYMVYPSLKFKKEIIKRMIDRGNDKNFINFQKKHYKKFIKEIIEENKNVPKGCCGKYPIQYGVELNKDQPYINNNLIGMLIDNCEKKCDC